MSKKLYYTKILCIILISSLLSCWALAFALHANMSKEDFAYYYMTYYLTLLFLSVVCCTPMLLLTDLIGKDWGKWVVWILKILNYHLPILVASPLFMFGEKYPLALEIPVAILLATEWLIKKQKDWKIPIFITSTLYLIHMIIFIIGIFLTLSFINEQVLS